FPSLYCLAIARSAATGAFPQGARFREQEQQNRPLRPRPDEGQAPERHSAARQSAPPAQEGHLLTDTTFAGFGLADPITRALAARGYTAPTPIQAQAIPMLMAG